MEKARWYIPIFICLNLQEKVWMIYAEKHFSIIERVWKEDSQLDYLSGNAGAIVVAVMLYKETGNLKYYEIAADMEKDLWKKGQKPEMDTDGD